VPYQQQVGIKLLYVAVLNEKFGNFLTVLFRNVVLDTDALLYAELCIAPRLPRYCLASVSTYLPPSAPCGPGVVRIDPLHFLAGCHTR